MQTSPPADSTLPTLPTLSTLPFSGGTQQAQTERDRLAVGVLARLTAALALLTWVSLPLQSWLGAPASHGHWRLATGALLLAGTVLALGLARAGRMRAATATLLAVIQLAVALFAWGSGLGLMSALLAGSPVLVVLAGVLADARVAWLIAGLQLAFLVLLYNTGTVSAAMVPASNGARFASHALVTVGALFAAVTVGRQVSRTLHEAWVKEHRMAELLRLGSDWTWEADRQGRITYISDSFERHTGRPVTEFLRIDQPGGPRMVHDAEWAELIDAMRARRPYRARVITFECADGQVVCVRGSAEPVLDASGKFVGWWGISQNVTGEVLAAREHERSRALLDRLVRLSPDAIAVVSLRHGHILLANPGFLDLVGRANVDEVLGRSVVDMGVWEDQAAAMALPNELAKEPVLRGLRNVVRRPDGSIRIAMISAARFEWDGEPVAVLIGHDITESERARLQGDAILNHAAVGMALVRRRLVEHVNPRLEELLGQPPGSMTGRPVADFFGDEASYEQFLAALRSKVSAGLPVEIDHEFVRPDGQRVLALLRSQLVDPRQPEQAGAIWVVEDITERRRAEQALAEAKAVAEAASDAKSAFLAHVSHEIRTPLNGVLGLARLMAEPGQTDGRRQEFLGYLIDAAESLNGIVSNVLDLSKMEAGKLHVEDIAFDLHDLVDKMYGAHAVMAEAKGLVLRHEIGREVPRRVRGDPLRLRQIVSNFIANAIKFTPSGEVVLRVGPGQDGCLRFEVSDSGIGIAPEVLGGLFQPFAQADHSTTRRYGGTGLGLSITRELAQLMGGKVGARSEPGRGATFWAELPLPAANDGMAASPAGQRGAYPLAGLRLLVAEDNPVNMLIAAEMLARLGARVTQASDGRQAVQACRARPGDFDVVLMDLHMPVLDGLAAVRLLRADPETAHLPVVAFSAAALDHERGQAREAGMADFVGKPVQPDDLVRALARFRKT